MKPPLSPRLGDFDVLVRCLRGSLRLFGDCRSGFRLCGGDRGLSDRPLDPFGASPHMFLGFYRNCYFRLFALSPSILSH